MHTVPQPVSSTQSYILGHDEHSRCPQGGGGDSSEAERGSGKNILDPADLGCDSEVRCLPDPSSYFLP